MKIYLILATVIFHTFSKLNNPSSKISSNELCINVCKFYCIDCFNKAVESYNTNDDSLKTLKCKCLDIDKSIHTMYELDQLKNSLNSRKCKLKGVTLSCPLKVFPIRKLK